VTNPRLQVEHPVTEEVTGLDLVELQLRIAATGSLGLTQEQVQVQGHAFEARIYAEDADAGFLPGAGRLHWLRFPETLLRVESGVDSGDEITPFYDPMIAKLVSRGATRAEALDRLGAGLTATDVVGLTTNVAFLRELLAWPETVQGRMHTRLIDQRWTPAARTASGPTDEALAAVALDWLRRERARCDWGAWTRSEFSGWRTRAGTPGPSTQPVVVLGGAGRSCAVHFSAPDAQGLTTLRLVEADRDRVLRARLEPAGESAVRVETQTQTRELRLFPEGAATLVHDAQGSWRVETTAPLAAAAAAAVTQSELKAPMMGKVVAVLAAEGDTVTAGQTVIVLESMKMELQVLTERGGRLGALRCAPGDMVGRGDVLCEVGD
jgi:3-methylcrotonyl-CoA carboxylase alpha subunit